MSASNKISPSHPSRKAMVYVPQSTMAQVREHTESTARQYALAEEAARLGWVAARIEVIDCDLGLSGRFGRAPQRLSGPGQPSLRGRSQRRLWEGMPLVAQLV
jgi:hypothetical protein